MVRRDDNRIKELWLTISLQRDHASDKRVINAFSCDTYQGDDQSLKAKRIILFFLLLSVLIPQVRAANFGEDDLYLGQVIDDYKNDDYLNITSNMIRNPTLECMELEKNGYIVNWGSMFLEEDFEAFSTGWTLGFGSLGTITKSNTQKHGGSWSSKIYAPNPTSYCYGYRGISETTGDSITEFWIWVDSSVEPDYEHVIGLYDISRGAYVYEVRLDYHDEGYYIQNDVSNVGTDVSEISAGEWVSIIIFFDDVINKLHYYINGFYMGVFDPNDDVGDGDRVYIGDTWGGGWRGYYYLDDLLIGEGSIIDRYFSSGYYTTIDMLNGDYGIALLYNATIPGGTGMTVEFWNGSAWVDHNNEPGSDSCVDGYEAFDIRDIYPSTGIVRVNQTGGVNTPLMNQLRWITVTTITAAGGLFPGLGIGISLLIVGAIYALEKRR